ncbi:MAG: hypothetical protein KKA73_02955 [Chloroflexi bacterium]|nr:hypothetical protein [Chloroflexota bacterium]MBU1746623.1 hypothetical protein [Chloroflexota bacterium]MBU1879645.1 hypothetical protein [Chloroflexota bacterium]
MLKMFPLLVCVLAACTPPPPTPIIDSSGAPIAAAAEVAPAPTAPPPTPAPTPEPIVPVTATLQVLAVSPAPGGDASVSGVAAKANRSITGVPVVPPGVPQVVQAGAQGLPEGVRIASYAWQLTAPAGSKTTLADVPADPATTGPTERVTLTPDQPGTYAISVTITTDAGVASTPAILNIEAATYVGVGGQDGQAAKLPQCALCHAQQTDKWAETRHASVLQTMLNTDPQKQYGPECLSCHVVGYTDSTTVETGGFADVARQLDWQLPAQTGVPGTYEALPTELKNLANVQCESCHGPGSAHKGDPAKIGVNLEAGACNQCHDDGRAYTTGEQLAVSQHAEAGVIAAPDGLPACARCHSPGGFVDFVNGVPEAQQRTQVGPIACATCHAPHGNDNYAQLRLVGTVPGAPATIDDAGLSAACMTCHNGRTSADKAPAEVPHYSTATELLAGQGGVDLDTELPNSPHGLLVGQTADPDQFGGQKPGSCVFCHMAETPGGDRNIKTVDGKDVPVTDPGHNQVGAHTFAMTSPDGQLEHIAVCQGCHPGITTFDFPASGDYDGNGKVEGGQTEVQGLLALVKQELVKSGVQVVATGDPYFEPQTITTDAQKSAIYNLRFVYGVMWSAEGPGGEGRAAAVHNLSRSVSLLQLAYKVLTGQDVPNAVQPTGFSHDDQADCTSCHTDRRPANHYAGQCSQCHTPTSWPNVQFDHTGRVDCASCHASRRPANHYPGQCSQCHTPTSWPSAQFDHTGQEDCTSCHAGRQPANHYAGQCSACHSTNGWPGAKMNHAGLSDCASCHASRRPANHYDGQCGQCHGTNAWSGAKMKHAGLTDCTSCHASRRPANHYGGQCSQCHSTNSWQGASVNHDNVTDCTSCHASRRPANHYGGQCSQCHSTNSWQGASVNHDNLSDCASCHASRRPANHYAGQCSQCHNTNSWQGATFSHSFPLNHGGANRDCASCHSGGGGGAWTCAGCHSPAKMDKEHQEIRNYNGNCVGCHPNGRKPRDGNASIAMITEGMAQFWQSLWTWSL